MYEFLSNNMGISSNNSDVDDGYDAKIKDWRYVKKNLGLLDVKKDYLKVIEEKFYADPIIECLFISLA